MYKLEDLFRMVPEGNWTLNKDGSLVDPNGNIVEIISNLSPVNKKLYSELIYELINRVPCILHDLTVERKKVLGLFKELRHTKGRVRESYSRGVSDAAAALHSVQVNTPTARFALIEASESMEQLLVD
ncbi:hypothetical protein LCGC14_0998370 [marine sediment metagenome]|uniref:Uncharacterized protein n=1 Tax=marine sediment metagenome TaxID=412755 RepID=A0A0F9R9X4_9ZZZZ